MALGGKYTLLPSSARQSALHSARASLVPRSCLTLLDWRPVSVLGHSLTLASVSVGRAILHNIPGDTGQVGSGEPKDHTVPAEGPSWAPRLAWMLEGFLARRGNGGESSEDEENGERYPNAAAACQCTPDMNSGCDRQWLGV